MTMGIGICSVRAAKLFVFQAPFDILKLRVVVCADSDFVMYEEYTPHPHRLSPSQFSNVFGRIWAVSSARIRISSYMKNTLLILTACLLPQFLKDFEFTSSPADEYDGV
jgi:hypothetical protein